MQVLKLRLDGRSQEEVAEILGTTRSNVSILERRAHQNIRRASRTLRQWSMIQAPVRVKVPAGSDVFDVPSLVFLEADRLGFSLPVTSIDIIVQLRTKAPEIVQRRILDKELELGVSKDGELIIEASD
jgi:Tfx family DNA-binding protein